MDSRTIAHVLAQIADLLAVRGANRFQVAAYRTAASTVRDLVLDDVGPLAQSGELDRLPGIGPATSAVIRELIETNESSLLERLRADTPSGLIDVLRVPGLGVAQVHRFYSELGIDSLESLEAAALDGRLARLPRVGPKSVEKILRGIASARQRGVLTRYPEAMIEARRVGEGIVQHPDIEQAVIGGSIRRHLEVIGDVDIVASCRVDADAVAASFARDGQPVTNGAVRIEFVDGIKADLYCVPADRLAAALWRATGSVTHVDQVLAIAAGRGLSLVNDTLTDATGKTIEIPDERTLYALLGLAYIEPELREGRGEVEAAGKGTLPSKLTTADIAGVLHTHSTYSDGRATIAEMAAGARDRGWQYLGISDHSQAAFYAGGMSPDVVRAQHAEIDQLNALAGDGFRILKGLEADILSSGEIDYGADVLDRFDYVIASVHSRFSMDRETMTARVLRALDDPHVTVLGHPTGRLLLARDPYAIDLEAVLVKAGALGVAIELNADPRRLDLDWRWCQRAKQLGVTIAIGPDAHSVAGLNNVEAGLAMARKGWLEPSDLLNCRDAGAILAYGAQRRR